MVLHETTAVSSPVLVPPVQLCLVPLVRPAFSTIGCACLFFFFFPFFCFHAPRFLCVPLHEQHTHRLPVELDLPPSIQVLRSAYKACCAFFFGGVKQQHRRGGANAKSNQPDISLCVSRAVMRTRHAGWGRLCLATQAWGRWLRRESRSTHTEVHTTVQRCPGFCCR